MKLIVHCSSQICVVVKHWFVELTWHGAALCCPQQATEAGDWLGGAASLGVQLVQGRTQFHLIDIVFEGCHLQSYSVQGVSQTWLLVAARLKRLQTCTSPTYQDARARNQAGSITVGQAVGQAYKATTCIQTWHSTWLAFKPCHSPRHAVHATKSVMRGCAGSSRRPYDSPQPTCVL